MKCVVPEKNITLHLAVQFPTVFCTNVAHKARPVSSRKKCDCSIPTLQRYWRQFQTPGGEWSVVLHFFWYAHRTLIRTFSWTYAEINEWQLTQQTCAADVRVQMSVLDEKCVFTALLQQTSYVIIYSISASPCWPTALFHTPASFSTCALMSPKSIVG